MLTTNLIATPLAIFIKQINTLEQKDRDKAIDDFCKQLESTIFNAIKKAQITLPPGSIIVTGSALSQTNPSAIILNNVIQ